jgi:hypothetical protein
VKPHITSWSEINVDKGYYCIWLMNNGLGPAIIESFVVKVDEHEIPGVADEPIQKGIAELFRNDTYRLFSSFMCLKAMRCHRKTGANFSNCNLLAIPYPRATVFWPT